MGNLTEAQVYEALGVTEPAGEEELAGAANAQPSGPDAPQGEKEQEAAAPATEADKGGKEQEVAAPAEPQENGDTPSADGDAEKTEEPADALTPEQRKENAARRRRQEQQAAIDAEVQKTLAEERNRARADQDEFFKTAKLKNSVTGEPITNMDEYRAWQRDFEAKRIQTNLQAGKLTPEDLNQVIAEAPAMKQAQEIIRRAEEEKRRQDAEAARVRMDAEIAEIAKLDPTIKSVQDLIKMPTYKEFYEYVKRGNTLSDAFYLVNREKIQSQTATAARQQAISNTRSKDHLNATGAGRGNGAATVPPEEMVLFRELMPKATEAEITAYYNNMKKGVT